jgi:hypothetical protein
MDVQEAEREVKPRAGRDAKRAVEEESGAEIIDDKRASADPLRVAVRATSITLRVLMDRNDVDGVRHTCEGLVNMYLRLDRPMIELQMLVKAYRFLLIRSPLGLQIKRLALITNLLLLRDGAEVVYLEMAAGEDLMRSLITRMVPPEAFQTRISNIGLTLLEAGVVQGHANNVFILLQAKASACVNARSPERPSPLHIAIGSIKILANKNPMALSSETTASRQDDIVKIIKLLCLNGADPNLYHPFSRKTALEALLDTTTIEPALETTVDALLNAKASPLGTYAHIDTATPLHCCLQHFSLPRKKVVMTLLQAKANPTVVDTGSCRTPLDLAIVNNFGSKVIRALAIPCGVCGLDSTMWCLGKSPYCRLAAVCSKYCFETLFYSHANACSCAADVARRLSFSGQGQLLTGNSVFERSTFHPSKVSLQLATNLLIAKEKKNEEKPQSSALHCLRHVDEEGPKKKKTGNKSAKVSQNV